MDITKSLPRPRKVILGGQAYRVGELTLNDMADLQGWIKDNVPHPLTAIRPYLEGLPPEDRRLLLAEAYKDAKDYPPRFGTPQGNELLFRSRDGFVFFMWTALKRHNRITQAEVEELYPRLTADEIDELFRGAHGSEPEDEIEAMVTGPKAIAEDK
jgi:hypothetical protein